MEAMQRAMSTKLYQDFVPPTELVHEPECDTLLVYLPGYKTEQLRVQLTKTRNLVISGEHPVGENTWRRFQKTIPISSNCDIGKITAKFEDLILYITQPKLITSAEKQDQNKPTSNHEDLTEEKQDQKKSTSNHEDLTAKKHDQEKPTSFKNPEPHKLIDKIEASDQKQADDTNVERKEPAENNAKKLSEKGNTSQNVEDNNDAKSVSDKISEVKQTKKTTETGQMKRIGDQKHKTDSGYFATKWNMRKEVINIVTAILVAIAFGMHVKYSVGSWKKAGKEDAKSVLLRK